MKHFFLLATIAIGFQASADGLLRDLPLRSKVIFGKEDFLEFAGGVANLSKIGCYVVSSEVVASPSTSGRTLDLIRVQEKIDTRLVKQPEEAFEYRFLEKGRLSPLSFVCHGEVSVSEIRSSLLGKGILWEAPADRVQASSSDILELTVGTVVRVEATVALGKSNPGAGIVISNLCALHLPYVQENFVLRKGTVFVMDKPPSVSDRQRSLSLKDVVSGADAFIRCDIPTSQEDLARNSTFLSIVPSPVTESIASTPENKPIAPSAPATVPDDIVDYPIGTIVRVLQNIKFASAYKEDPGVFFLETFNSLGGCHMSALGASSPYLLRKGQILRLERQPYLEKSGRYSHYVLDFQDASSSQKFKLSCKGSRGSLTSVSSFEVALAP